MAGADWTSDRLTVVAQDPLAETGGAVHLLRGQKPVLFVEAPRVTIQQFMVEYTERNAIFFRIGTTGLMPFT